LHNELFTTIGEAVPGGRIDPGRPPASGKDGMRSEAASSRPLVRGRVESTFGRRGGEAGLSEPFHHDPSTAVAPTMSGDGVGGDRLDIRIAAGPDWSVCEPVGMLPMAQNSFFFRACTMDGYPP
jgi:hypothetical protein